MSSIIERAKAHYSALPTDAIKVPEWGTGDAPLVVTWKKMTVRDEERIYATVDGRPAPGGTVRMRAVMLKACGEDGKRLFDEMDEHALRFEVDGEVIGRIANAILFRAGLVDADGMPKGVSEQVDTEKKP